MDDLDWKATRNWKPWFAWFPVRLLTMEWAWLRTVDYRKPARGGQWSFFGSDYSNPMKRDE